MRDRLLASAWDYLVILAILTGSLVVGWTASGLVHGSSGPVWRTDLIAFAGSVLPTWVYLSLTEGGTRHATWGKRRRRLVVIRCGGGEMGLVRSGVRNVVKLLPWQLAHLAVARLALEVEAPVVIGSSYGTATILVVLTLGLAWRSPDHRALHDLIAGTRVERH